MDGASLSVSAWLISSTSTSSPSFWGTFSSTATAASGCGSFVPRSREVLRRLRSPLGEGLCAEPLVEDLSFFFFFFVPVPDFFFWNIFSCKRKRQTAHQAAEKAAEMQTSQRSLWTSRAWPRHMHEFLPFPFLPPVSSAFPSRRFPLWISRAVLSRSPWDFMEISFTHVPIRVYYHNRHFQLCCRPVVDLITWFPKNFDHFRGTTRFHETLNEKDLGSRMTKQIMTALQCG